MKKNRKKDIIIRGVLDVFFPKFCFKCKNEGRHICQDCSLFLTEAELVCPVCFRGCFSGEVHQKCKGKLTPNGLVSFFDYEGVLKSSIFKGKQESLVDVFREVAEYGFLSMAKNRERFFPFLSHLYQSNTVLTFVPLSDKTERKRGFNQSEEIAKSVSLFTGVEIKRLLVKQKENRPQKDLNKEQRELNVKGIFSVNKKETLSKRVVLIDDVWTSGATAKECVRVLKKEGVESVWVLVLARVF